MNSKLIRRNYPEYMLVLALLLYLVFILGPNVASFFYSFTNWNAYTGDVKFTGLQNLKDMLGISAGIPHVMLNTIIFAMASTVFKIVFGMILAVFLNEAIRTRNALRAIYFMPMMIATIVVGVMFTQIYRPDGLLNECLRAIGLGALAEKWITDPTLAIWSCAGVEVWRASGFAMAVFLAALQMVPKEIYEAVDVDGANRWQKFVHVTLPFLYQAIELNVIFGLISGLKVFDIVYLVTNGGPGRASEVLNVTVLNEYSKGLYGYSTALGMILFIFITVIYFGASRLLTKFEVDVT